MVALIKKLVLLLPTLENQNCCMARGVTLLIPQKARHCDFLRAQGTRKVAKQTKALHLSALLNIANRLLKIRGKH